MMLCKTVIIVYVAMVVYIAVGGVIFHFIETPNENRRVKQRCQIYTDFINKTGTSKSEVDQFLTSIGVDVRKLDINHNSTTWTVSNSMFFASVVVSTIGYGHMTPTTNLGQVFCVVYALVGIPIHCVLLAAIGNKIGDCLLKHCFRRRLLKHKKLDLALKYFTLYVTIVALTLLLPAWLISVVEEWTYLESIYFAFITVTTIGFGDYVAGQDADKLPSGPLLALYNLFTGAWLLFGLAIVASNVSFIASMISSKVKTTERSLRRNTARSHDVTDGHTCTVVPGQTKEVTVNTTALGSLDTCMYERAKIAYTIDDSRL